ncbi:hypothetical protein EII10_12085 [Actinomyces bowdenii]|uniref:Uncharacterized protein n=1 Tax=Actinomyces bowdenii TaxID=131109 RepID=A0A3P1US82_9ACTO|nr:hypothetical protein EII10_12085 [Actinomyces bowdenii]
MTPAAQAPAQSPWVQQGASTVVPEGPFSAQSAPVAPSAPGAHGQAAAGQAIGHEGYAAPGAQAAGSHAAAPQAPASPHTPGASQPWGSRSEGEVGMSSVFPVATARAEAERGQQGASPQGPQAPVASQWDAVASGPSVPQASPVAPAAQPVAQGASQPEAFPVRTERQEGGEDSLGGWLLAILLAALPVVGFFYLLVVAFTTGSSPTRRAWARAMLIWMVVGAVLGLVSIVAFGGSLLALGGSQGA